METETLFHAVEHDEDTTTDLGVVALDGSGTLRIVSAAADGSDRLATIVGELNAETVMHVNVPPPKEARRFEVFTRAIPRGGEGFTAALLDQLRRYHGIELKQP